MFEIVFNSELALLVAIINTAGRKGKYKQHSETAGSFTASP